MINEKIWLIVLLVGLLNPAIAETEKDDNGRRCFNEYEALAAIRIKAEVSLNVPDQEYQSVNRFNSSNLGVFIPSNSMKAVFTNRYPSVVFIVYMSGDCASGLIAMIREDYSKITGMP